VLVGASLGHFVTSFIYKAFMGLPEGAPMVSLSPSKRGALIDVSLRW